MGRFRALPYARALFEVVRDSDPGRADAVAEELDAVAQTLEAVPDFHRALTTPTVPVEIKSEILDAVMDALGTQPPTRRFLHVVQQHYRMEHMQNIAAAYRELVDRAAGRTRASIELAGELAEQERTKVVAGLALVLGIDVVASFESKPELLAGFRVRVGSRVFDGSLVGQVDRLSRQTLTE
jgi:F-type H+-transporting ATPase subunit delta